MPCGNTVETRGYNILCLETGLPAMKHVFCVVDVIRLVCSSLINPSIRNYAMIQVY